MPRANPTKGEAALGDQLLRINFGAWMAFEEKTGRRLPEHLLDLELGLGAGQMVDWVEAFLVAELDRAAIAELLDQVGILPAQAAIARAVASFFGKPARDLPENPPKAP